MNVIGEGEGAFYIEVSNGKVNVQPYDYVDRNACISVTAETLTAVTKGAVNYCEVVRDSRMQIDGDEQAAAVLDSIRLMREKNRMEPITRKNEPEQVPENIKSTAKKSHVRKRALKKFASKAKNSKKAG